MSGGAPSVRKPPDPAPSPEPILGREEDEAKKKARKRAKRGGRQSTILAGRMMASRNDTNILKTKLA